MRMMQHKMIMRPFPLASFFEVAGSYLREKQQGQLFL